jgi:hypothetical protein
MYRPNTDWQLLDLAYERLAAVPKERFTLDQIVCEKDGQSCGDAAYWLSQDPFFKALGLAVERVGGIYLRGRYMGARLSLAALFRIDVGVIGILFGPRSPREAELPALSDKELLLGRLRFYMNEYARCAPAVPYELEHA